MIEFQNIFKSFKNIQDGTSISALENVSFTQKEGEFLAIMGPSGCGKSTLLNIVAGFELKYDGACRVNGSLVTNTGPDRGVVFQEYALFPWMTVEENMTFAMKSAGKWTRNSSKITSDILERMGLSTFLNSFPKSLSGGMRQRLAIARIIAIDSPMMLMDEPFGALDALTRNILQKELVSLWRETKKTIFFITHSADEAIYLADRVIVMTSRPGKIVLELNIDIERPRDPTSLSFNEYKRKILQVLKTD